MYRVALLALANPYAGGMRALDHEGRPVAAFMRHGSPDQAVGAQLHAQHSDKEQRAIYTHSDQPSLIVCNTPGEYAYYKRGFEEGHLLPADEATAKRIFGPDQKFTDLVGVIEAAKAKAVAEWRQAYGASPLCAATNEHAAESTRAITG